MVFDILGSHTVRLSVYCPNKLQIQQNPSLFSLHVFTNTDTRDKVPRLDVIKDDYRFPKIFSSINQLVKQTDLVTICMAV